MSEHFSRSTAAVSMAKKTTLAEFASWPPGRRKDFVRRELTGCPAFIVEALLRVA